MRVKLQDAIELFDHKRIPLSGKERESLENLYPYYGAQGIIDYVDRYIFDGEYWCPAHIGHDGWDTLDEYDIFKEEEIIYDDKLEYPELYEGESKFLQYGKRGYKSQATLIKVVDGKEISRKIIRKDKYLASRGVIIYGKAQPPVELEQENNELWDILKGIISHVG